eukprot:scaffold535_cov65-Cylindrotheca_fusiformis.AAC.17
MKKKSLAGGLPNRTSSVEKIPVAKNVSLSPESRERNQTVSIVKKKKKSRAGGLPNRTSSVEKIPVAKNVSLSPESRERNQAVSVVVQLSGEMGNNVLKMTNGLCIKHMIEEKLGLRVDFILRAQEKPKWKVAMRSMKRIFPKTRHMDFRKGNIEEFERAQKQQLEWLEMLNSTKKLDLANIEYPEVLGMQNNCETKRCYQDLIQLLNQTWYMDPPANQSGAIFSIPHVFANTFAVTHCFDLMYEELRAFFEVDRTSICRKAPEPDETVFHYRNFITEMPDAAIRKGFEELDPNMTARYLFANYTSGEKVAIVSRFEHNTEKYKRALKDIKGIKARYIDGQTGDQDFCFLLKAKKELIGVKDSTFALVAGYLGDAKRVRLYSFDTPERRAVDRHFFAYSFENKKLRDRMIFENYNTTGD